MIYKTLQKVSNVCQLLDKSKYPATQTINGVTFTNNGDGTITANGTATGLCQYRITNSYKKLIGENTNKCLLVGSISANSGTPYYLQLDFIEGNSWSRAALDFGKGVIFTNSDSSLQLLSIIVKSGVTVNNLTFKPQLFDLTEMYGAGNEPTTVEQFRQDFPEEMYDYSPHCFVKSYKTLLKASDYCQLIDKSKYPSTRTINGVTFSNNGDGTITANGTATRRAVLSLFNRNLPVIHGKGLIIGDPAYDQAFINYTFENSDGHWIADNASYNGEGTIFTGRDDAVKATLYIAIEAGATANNLTFKPQLFDLTEIYGAGNEPTTVEQFKADFPDELYDYKPYSTIPSYKKSLVCKTKNLLNPNTCNIYQSVTYGMNIELIDNNQTVHVYGTSTNTSAYASFNVIKTSDKSIYNKGYKIKFFNLAGKNPPVIRNIYGLREVDTYGQIAITVDIIEGVYYDFSFRIMVSEQTATDYVPYGHL